MHDKKNSELNTPIYPGILYFLKNTGPRIDVVVS